MSHKTDRRALAALDALYAEIPRVTCRGLCAQACGPLPVISVEALRMRRADTRRRPPAAPGNRCVYLTPRERCSVYDARPFVCRIYGAIKNLSCPHGCVPDRWMSPHDTARLFARLTKIGAWQLTTPEGLVAYDDADGTIAAITGGAAHMPAAVVEALAEHVRGLRALHGGHVLAATPGPTNRMVDIDDVSHARAIVKAHTPENAEKG